jgi:adenylate cyclase class IV
VRRTVFDFPDRRLQQSRSWVRLREELDGSIELMLKTVAADEIGQTFEQPVTVTDYEAAHAFLRSIGLDAKG